MRPRNYLLYTSRRAQDVAGAFAAAEAREDLDLVFSVAEARRNPYFNMVKVVGDHVEKVIESPYTARQQAPACLLYTSSSAM